MKNKKINTIIYIVAFVFVFIMFIATSYAYYNKVIKKDGETKETNSFNMLVMFNTSNIIDVKNPKKGYNTIKEFTVENFSKDTIGKYSIDFEVVTPLSNMVDENFIYTLEGASDSKDNTNKVINIPSTPVPVLSKTIGSGVITPKNIHSYKLNVSLNSNNYIKNSMFNALIKIKINN